MSSKGGLISIDNVVRQAIADKGYNTLHLYARYLHFALGMFRKLNIDNSEEIKTVSIPVTSKKTVPYPDDYITYSKVGIKLGDRIMCFIKDNTLTTHHDDAFTANPEFFNVANAKFGTFYFYNYNSDRAVGEIDSSAHTLEVNGYAHNGLGYFKPDDKCREFQLSSEVRAKEVILEYISDGIDLDSETFVNAMAVDVIKEYIHYQDARYRKGVSISERRDDERKWLDQLAAFNMRLSDLSFQGILDVSRRSQGNHPKM